MPKPGVLEPAWRLTGYLVQSGEKLNLVGTVYVCTYKHRNDALAFILLLTYVRLFRRYKLFTYALAF